MKYCKKCGIGAVHSDSAKRCVICGGTDFEHDEFATRQRQQRQTQERLNLPKCPTCSSTNIEKISSFDKAAGAVMFGLFSKTARSQFKCRNCGYKW